MRPRSYSRIRETAFDLYTEREQLPWYFNAAANFSTCLTLAGYVLFSLVFTSQEDNLQTKRSILTTLAGVALLTGYVALLITALLARSLLFAFDAVIVPTLTSSILGVFTTVMNHALHKRFTISTQAYIYVPLVVSCTTTVISAILCAWVFRRLKEIKRLDKRRRTHIPMDAYSGTPPFTNSNQELLSFVPDDEALRRQLLRLLLARDTRNASMEDARSTYKIDLPGDEAGGNRQRSGSLPNTSRWNLSALVPGRGRSPTADSFKDPRERRREEIERASMLSPDPHALHAGSGWPGHSNVPPAWSNGAVRYA